MADRKRRAAVAGYFYPRDPAALKRRMIQLLSPDQPRKKALAVVSPHAGYDYSGPVAGAVFSSVEMPETFIILAPSHRSIGSIFAIMKDGVWETPLGDVSIQTELAESLARRSARISVDPEAHEAEHALEVQLPFIQSLTTAPSIVPVAVSVLARAEDLLELGHAVAASVRDFGRDVLLVASTDMSHYISAAEARIKDFLAIRKILDLDPGGLIEIVRDEDISMCGFQPTAAVLIAALDLGATKADLIMYATSGDRTGNQSEVVGYAGIRIA
jgi:hypothetical protein